MLVSLVQRLHTLGARVNHVETRPDNAEIGELELLVQVQCNKSVLVETLTGVSVQLPIDRIVVQRAHRVDARRRCCSGRDARF